MQTAPEHRRFPGNSLSRRRISGTSRSRRASHRDVRGWSVGRCTSFSSDSFVDHGGDAVIDDEGWQTDQSLVGAGWVGDHRPPLRRRLPPSSADSTSSRGTDTPSSAAPLMKSLPLLLGQLHFLKHPPRSRLSLAPDPPRTGVAQRRRSRPAQRPAPNRRTTLAAQAARQAHQGGAESTPFVSSLLRRFGGSDRSTPALQPLLIANQHRRPVRRGNRASPRGTLLVIRTHATTLHAAARPIIGTKGRAHVPITSIAGTRKMRGTWRGDCCNAPRKQPQTEHACAIADGASDDLIVSSKRKHDERALTHALPFRRRRLRTSEFGSTGSCSAAEGAVRRGPCPTAARPEHQRLPRRRGLPQFPGGAEAW